MIKRNVKLKLKPLESEALNALTKTSEKIQG